jgi:hypothetical protein
MRQVDVLPLLERALGRTALRSAGVAESDPEGGAAS